MSMASVFAATFPNKDQTASMIFCDSLYGWQISLFSCIWAKWSKSGMQGGDKPGSNGVKGKVGDASRQNCHGVGYTFCKKLEKHGCQAIGGIVKGS